MGKNVGSEEKHIDVAKIKEGNKSSLYMDVLKKRTGIR